MRRFAGKHRNVRHTRCNVCFFVFGRAYRADDSFRAPVVAPEVPSALCSTLRARGQLVAASAPPDTINTSAGSHVRPPSNSCSSPTAEAATPMKPTCSQRLHAMSARWALLGNSGIESKFMFRSGEPRLNAVYRGDVPRKLHGGPVLFHLFQPAPARANPLHIGAW